ncbi:MAG TPA: hypothetical protein VFO23_08125, partial [Steroidobacteraceae bacterium]|nr:hypothetical protein [Steroidobacteraceae bacterium]
MTWRQLSRCLPFGTRAAVALAAAHRGAFGPAARIATAIPIAVAPVAAAVPISIPIPAITSPVAAIAARAIGIATLAAVLAPAVTPLAVIAARRARRGGGDGLCRGGRL